MSPADLVGILRSKGRLQAGVLAQTLGVSRATLMRLAQGAGEQIVVGGRARRTTYAARRLLRGSTAPIPVFRVDGQGDLTEIARLDLTVPDGCAAEFMAPFGWPLNDAMQAGWFDGLPYPLADMRPQGFIGRNFARRHAALLQVADDPRDWTDDDALHAMSLLGSDLPGDLIVGEPACRHWLDTAAESAPVRARDTRRRYDALADVAMAQGVDGSSAGGEFPKFTTARELPDARIQHVLVKFSGSDDSPGTQRWADLLVCEHLAGLALQQHLGVRAAVSRIHRGSHRTYLEVDRFDRHGARGRSGVVSWSSLDAALFGLGGASWVDAARHLAASRWLSDTGAADVARLWHFGQLIGNNDMHAGNLSFQSHGHGDKALLQPAPAYDMLPMRYAPARGVELPAHRFAPKLPLPAERVSWQRAAVAAKAFWQAAAADRRISDGFRATCAENATVVDTILAR